jgi:uncharacterized protein (DUF427 family)
MLKEVKIPGPDHPITIAPTMARVVVRVGEHVIAASDTALRLSEAGYAPVQYVPIGDVDTTLIERSETETYCPYKGAATYYAISLPAARSKTQSGRTSRAGPRASRPGSRGGACSADARRS